MEGQMYLAQAFIQRASVPSGSISRTSSIPVHREDAVASFSPFNTPVLQAGQASEQLHIVVL